MAVRAVSVYSAQHEPFSVLHCVHVSIYVLTYKYHVL